MNIDEQIKTRIEELNEKCKILTDEQKAIAYPLIENVAFIETQLEELQKIIKEEGTVDEYQNGNNQRGKKQSATLQCYTSLIKSYNIINARLEKMLSSKSNNNQRKTNSLEEFIKRIEDEADDDSDDLLFYEPNEEGVS